MSYLPFVMQHDVNGNALQTLGPEMGTNNNGTIAGASTRVAIPSGSIIVRLSSTGDVYFKFGDNTVVAASTDILFPAGAEYYRIDPVWTHVAFIQVGTSTGVFSIARML